MTTKEITDYRKSISNQIEELENTTLKFINNYRIFYLLFLTFSIIFKLKNEDILYISIIAYISSLIFYFIRIYFHLLYDKEIVEFIDNNNLSLGKEETTLFMKYKKYDNNLNLISYFEYSTLIITFITQIIFIILNYTYIK